MLGCCITFLSSYVSGRQEYSRSNRYDVAVQFSSAPGLFHRTKIISFMPRFILINELDTPLYFRDAGIQGRSRVPVLVLQSKKYTPLWWKDIGEQQQNAHEAVKQNPERMTKVIKAQPINQTSNALQHVINNKENTTNTHVGTNTVANNTSSATHASTSLTTRSSSSVSAIPKAADVGENIHKVFDYMYSILCCLSHCSVCSSVISVFAYLLCVLYIQREEQVFRHMGSIAFPATGSRRWRWSGAFKLDDVKHL